MNDYHHLSSKGSVWLLVQSFRLHFGYPSTGGLFAPPYRLPFENRSRHLRRLSVSSLQVLLSLSFFIQDKPPLAREVGRC